MAKHPPKNIPNLRNENVAQQEKNKERRKKVPVIEKTLKEKNAEVWTRYCKEKQEHTEKGKAKSHEDLNHLKLYKQGASPPQGTHFLTLLTLFDLESRNPIYGLLGLLIFTSTPFSAIVLRYAVELVT
ncbi:hypothetical protein PIB30_101271 [Stylosanthes scabra]|uniref:Uncharacterized protein n=1 Tax=Stylosanthes scabra TaxID=79078 RepID=A0ABU6TZQ8_9FABA|nr:hypothetical protein [Stylosanthes scabra]